MSKQEHGTPTEVEPISQKKDLLSEDENTNEEELGKSVEEVRFDTVQIGDRLTIETDMTTFELTVTGVLYNGLKVEGNKRDHREGRGDLTFKALLSGSIAIGERDSLDSGGIKVATEEVDTGLYFVTVKESQGEKEPQPPTPSMRTTPVRKIIIQ